MWWPALSTSGTNIVRFGKRLRTALEIPFGTQIASTESADDLYDLSLAGYFRFTR